MDASKYLNNGQLKFTVNEDELVIEAGDFLLCNSIIMDDDDLEKIKNTVGVMQESFNLLQIAEMFRDYLMSNNQDNSIAFQVTNQVLERINNNQKQINEKE